MPIILAHGALGIFDELIFIGAVVIFLVMAGISWMRSRYGKSPLDETPTPPPTTDADSADHFPLQ